MQALDSCVTVLSSIRINKGLPEPKSRAAIALHVCVKADVL